MHQRVWGIDVVGLHYLGDQVPADSGIGLAGGLPLQVLPYRRTERVQVVEANNIEAPHSLVHRLMHGYAEMYKVPEDQLPAFEQQFHQIAETQVKRDLALDTLVEAHGLKATEAELDERINTMAGARGVPAGQIYASLEKSKRLGELERAITEEKVFDFLLKQSTVEEVES